MPLQRCRSRIESFKCHLYRENAHLFGFGLPLRCASLEFRFQADMSSVSDKVRVVIADDERPARSFLAAVLRKFDDVELVGEASNGMEAVALIESKRPDLALIDLRMPELDGL